jgi:apolipoprotein D and lipocalin family protein
MKIIAPFAAGLLLGLYWKAARAETAAAARAPLATIAALDVPRYMGTWYEIAKYPNRFQKKCASDTSATYSVRADGRVQVVNRCRTTAGDATQAAGVARQIGGATSPTLEVRFAPALLSFLPMVWGDYWVIDLDDAYQVSVVSEPKREFLWILARTPHIDPAVYDAVVARLAARGFDTAKLERTVQGR